MKQNNVVIRAIAIFIVVYSLFYFMKEILVSLHLYDEQIIIPSIVFSSVLVALIGIHINNNNNLLNKEYDEAKEQLKYLYTPLNALIQKEHKTLVLQKHLDIEGKNGKEEFAIKYYNFFLKLRDVYLDNQVYGSLDLFSVFHSLIHHHEIELRNYTKQYKKDEEIIKGVALFELYHKVDEDNMSEFERLIEKVIDVVYKDMYTIANNKKPVKRYYQE